MARNTTAAIDLHRTLLRAGWAVVRTSSSATVYGRWKAGAVPIVREELHLVLDVRGRLRAWSAWESTRLTSPDQAPGCRLRLLEHVHEAGRRR